MKSSIFPTWFWKRAEMKLDRKHLMIGDGRECYQELVKRQIELTNKKKDLIIMKSSKFKKYSLSSEH